MSNGDSSLTVRAITLQELDEFIHMGQSSHSPEQLREWLLTSWKKGESFPEWCFIAEHNGQWIGRVAYWSFPASAADIKMFGLSLPWDDPHYLEIGKNLMANSLHQMQQRGATNLEGRLYVDSPFLEERKAIFGALGIPIIQDKMGFVCHQWNHQPIHPEWLHFKSLADIGEETFVQAIQLVSQETLDRQDLMMISRLGAGPAAVEYFRQLKEMDCQPEWWQLAYDDDQQLIGLVVAQQLQSDEAKGVINYLGVVPPLRGQGFGYDLLQKGLHALFEAGVTEVIADVDANNEPLVRALYRAGFEHVDWMSVYWVEIDALPLCHPGA